MLLSIAVGLLSGVTAHAEAPDRAAALDQAVGKALTFLQNTQEADGGWREHGQKSHAITALSVMAFLSAGHVPGEGTYGPTVEKGVRWILNSQQPNGLMAPNGGHEMYHHGICTLLLAEVAGMTDADLAAEVRRKLVKAVALVLKAQRLGTGRKDDRGGWRYHVSGIDSDLSVTGWQLLALRAAKNVGCDVPAERIDLAVEYVLRCQNSANGGFCYMPGTKDSNSARTGTGILALELCGKDRHHSAEALRGGAYLIQPEHLPAITGRGSHFFYSVYYCSQAMFQLGDNYWNAFRPRLHTVLLANQGTNGSWTDPNGLGAPYATAMAVLALTVEYRFLPIYQRGEEPAEPGKE